jgi:hypothetical protein
MCAKLFFGYDIARRHLYGLRVTQMLLELGLPDIILKTVVHNGRLLYST